MESYTPARLRKVLSVIDKDYFDMSDWSEVKERVPNAPYHPCNQTPEAVRYFTEHRKECGTACCLAGWTPTAFPPTKEEIERYGHVADYARDKLGLTVKEENELFYVHSWPIKFANVYYAAKTGTARLKALRGMIKDFIERNKPI